MLTSRILVLLLVFSAVAIAAQIDETIKCIQDYLQTYKDKMNPKLFNILVKAFPNTMTTTVQHYDLTPNNESTYIITGDIEAMWLRDSTNQFIPYIRMPKECPHIQALTRGILNTQANFIMTDVYTNAFKLFEPSTAGRPFSDVSETLIFGLPIDLIRKKEYATKVIWERKFQIDSPAAFLRLSHQYFTRYNNTKFFNINYFKALDRIVSLLQEETKDSFYQAKQGQKFYTFYRNVQELPGGSIGLALNTGMVKTGFRPSDSPNELPYNVPGNAMISSYLRLVSRDILSQVPSSSVYFSWSKNLAQKMSAFAESIKTAIDKYGVVKVDGEEVYAYEVDGRGNYRVYDDSNVPAILSMPYLGFVSVDDPIYQSTRRFILSSKNRYFYQNGQVKGVGSSHTPDRYIWPLALITQVLTSNDQGQMRNCLSSLVLAAKDDLMHESFSVDNPKQITRQWFAWANSFFGEMIMHLAQTKPDILK